jgi:hypothetical protein
VELKNEINMVEKEIERKLGLICEAQKFFK